MAPVNLRGGSRLTRSSKETPMATLGEATKRKSNPSKTIRPDPSFHSSETSASTTDFTKSKVSRKKSTAVKSSSRKPAVCPGDVDEASKSGITQESLSAPMISSSPDEPNVDHLVAETNIRRSLRHSKTPSSISTNVLQVQTTKTETTPCKKDTDSFAQPRSKKKRMESGDSCSSELQQISVSTDSGFETESCCSTSPAFQILSPSPMKEELEIDFSSPQSIRLESAVNPYSWPKIYNKSKNVYHYLCNMSLGRLSSSNKKVVEDHHTVSHVADFEIVAHDKPFSSRITTIDWHPRKQNFFSVTSKHGDLGFYRLGAEDNRKLDPIKTFAGFGPGGYVSAFKFHPVNNERFYTATLEGKVALGNIERGFDHVEKVLHSTGTWE